MRSARLSLALEDSALELPEEGRIAVFHARAGHDLSALPQARVEVIQGLRPDHDFWAQRGYQVDVAPAGEYAAAIVFLPRAKVHAHALIAQASASAPGGLIVVDGQKTDGIDSIYRALRKTMPVSHSLAKSHGKIFWFINQPAFSGWAKDVRYAPAPGFETVAGVFSADKVDAGSSALARVLPQRLPGQIADLGAGWGYLSAAILARGGVKTLYLVEADTAALECARHNIRDPRAQFHWADALVFRADVPLDMVVMNPPFHTTRAASPGLGQAFIAAAASMLKPTGQLWMVANRHLPYETVLQAEFGRVEEVGDDPRFKLIHASHPKSTSRKRR